MSRRKQNNLQLVAPTQTVIQQERSSKCKVSYNDLKNISPLNFNQRTFFEIYDKQASAVLLHGVAGTGKTFIALYKALEEVLDSSSNFERVIVVRSAVPSREIGHLPGDEKEKTEVYTMP
jgi:predicted ribonuclease YlaK